MNSLSKLPSIIKDCVVSGIKEGFAEYGPEYQGQGSNKRKRPVADSDPNYADYDDDNDYDDDLPEVGMDVVRGDTASRLEIFGTDVNESEYEDLSEDEDDPDNSYVPSHQLNRNPPQSTNDAGVASSVSTPSAPVDESDPDLPSLTDRLPSNWNPTPKIMNFVKRASDVEWSKDERQEIIKRFHPSEELDPYFSPVKLPTKLYKTLKSPAAKKKDFLFNRHDVEKHLYNANLDLCTSLRPLIEVFCMILAMKPSKKDSKATKEMSTMKNLIGLCIKGICSANIKISRGRRELTRRYVRLDWSEALYAVNPTHASIFGGSSLDEAIKAAKEVSKSDNSLVYAPKRKKPFRPSFAAYKDFQYPNSYQGRGGKTQGYRQPFQYQNNQYSSGNNKSKGQFQRPRGKGRGGKRGAKSSRAANSQE